VRVTTFVISSQQIVIEKRLRSRTRVKVATPRRSTVAESRLLTAHPYARYPPFQIGELLSVFETLSPESQRELLRAALEQKQRESNNEQTVNKRN
jgi:hypothetical protein